MAARLSNGRKLSLRPKLSVTLCTLRVRLIHPPRPRVICLYEEEVEVKEEEEVEVEEEEEEEIVSFFFLWKNKFIFGEN